MTTERENWIDWSKVFLIYLVVVGHSNLISHENNAFLTAFHMPAFFILAGYLHRNTIGFKKIFIRILPGWSSQLFFLVSSAGVGFYLK